MVWASTLSWKPRCAVVSSSSGAAWFGRCGEGHPCSGAAVGDVGGAAHGCRTGVVFQAGPLLEGAGDDVRETAEGPHFALGRRSECLFDAVIAWDIDGVNPVHRGGYRGTVSGQQDLAAGGPGIERAPLSENRPGG